jgi:starvation-inducible DNA-binding protein
LDTPKASRRFALEPHCGYGEEAVRDISRSLNLLLADSFAMYLKIKNFHWHVSGPEFRDYHLLLDEQGDQVFGMIDPLAERVRKLGGVTLRSEAVDAKDMLAELREDNRLFAVRLREAHGLCDEHRDLAGASLLESLIDAAERRVWLLFEATRRA